MAFSYKNSKGKEYFLHSRTTNTASGSRTLYFFSGEQGEGVLDKVPQGYTVSETANGLPVLKKEGGADGGKSGDSGARSAGASKSGAGSKSGAKSSSKK